MIQGSSREQFELIRNSTYQRDATGPGRGSSAASQAAGFVENHHFRYRCSKPGCGALIALNKAHEAARMHPGEEKGCILQGDGCASQLCSSDKSYALLPGGAFKTPSHAKRKIDKFEERQQKAHEEMDNGSIIMIDTPAKAP